VKAFSRLLRERQSDSKRRRWLFVPYDQLSHAAGPLAEEDPGELGIILIESRSKAERRPYHKQKLALVLTNQRHFALEQAERGVAIRYVATSEPYGPPLESLASELGALRVREPAERELRADLASLVASGALEVVPHGGWLTTREQFRASQPKEPPWRMDAFYRHVRRETGILMEGGSPIGGKFSFDAENRKPWSGEPSTPEPPEFEPDTVTMEVCEMIQARFGDHPGALRPKRLPATAEDADSFWDWAKTECLEHFGPFEDAMSVRSTGLFHTRISPLLNLGRLTARDVLDEVLALELPLASREGFVRQLLGWREFVRHVHRETDGFRSVPGGWATTEDVLGRADPSHLGASDPLPAAFWGRTSGLGCLDSVVGNVWEEGWSHHITRLMVLSNIATLLDVRPREITDWFWAMYIDAYDWVVEPNVLAMGTYGLGDLMTTKPYVSGSNYIDRMSDYCERCRFDARLNCPLRRLYWAFLARHEPHLSGNPRLALPLATMRKRGEEQRDLDDRAFEWVRATLAAGAELQPDT
jgi:deoxyribodipyrimidine photolyase-related protein